ASVQNLTIQYVLPDGDLVRQSASWQGPAAVHDGISRIFVRQAEIEQNYIEGVQGLEAFDGIVAEQVAELLCTDAAAVGEVVALIKKTLERPSVVLDRLRRIQQQHQIHQYYDQAADPEFAPLFETYQRTKEGTSHHKELEERLLRLLAQRFVDARRDQ